MAAQERPRVIGTAGVRLAATNPMALHEAIVGTESKRRTRCHYTARLSMTSRRRSIGRRS